MTSEEYVRDRLENQISWYDRKANSFKHLTVTLRIIEIAAAALIPIVAVVSQEYKWDSAILTTVLGSIIITTTGISSLSKAPELWLEYRTTAESLKKEKILFETNTEPYHDGKEAFSLLVQRVETLVSKETTNWAQYMMKPGKNDAHGH